MDRGLPSFFALTVDLFNGTDENSAETLFFPESRDLLGGRHLPIGNDKMWPIPLLGPPMENRSIFNQPQFELYDNEKGFFYYFFNVLCVLSILFAIVMNSILLELLRRRWKFLIRRPFFFLLFVFCLVNFVSALCSVVTEVPVATFLDSSSPHNGSSEISDYTFTTLYTVFYNLKLVCEQMVQYLNFLIALLRLLVFVFPLLEEKIFHYYMLYIHVIWTLIASIVLVSYMYAFSCYLRYEVMVAYVNFGCLEMNNIDAAPVIWWYYSTTFFLPGVDFLFYVIILIKFLIVRKAARSRRMEITVLIQSVVLFLSFEVSGLLTMYLFAYPNFDRSVIFVGRRIFDTVYTLASGLSPLFVLLTNTDLPTTVRFVPIDFDNEPVIFDDRGCLFFSRREPFDEPRIEVPVAERGFFFTCVIIIYILTVLLAMIVNLIVSTLIVSYKRKMFTQPFLMLFMLLVVINLATGLCHIVQNFPVVLFLNSTLEAESCTSDAYNYTITGEVPIVC